MMSEQIELQKRLDHWTREWMSGTGGWFAGKRVVMHGKNILSQMSGCTWMEMILFAVTHKEANKKQAEFLDAVLAMSGCIPDPRLWNNRVSALAGTARSTSALGVSAGMAISDAIIFGFQPMLAAFTMLESLLPLESASMKQQIEERLQTKPGDIGKPGKGKQRAVASIAGYGRPVAAGDERIPPLMEVAKKYNYHDKPAVLLAFAIEKYLQHNGHSLRLNTGGLIAAFCLDQQLTKEQFYYYISHCFCVSLLACHDDTSDKPEGAFFPLRCDQVNYIGQSERKWRSA